MAGRVAGKSGEKGQKYLDAVDLRYLKNLFLSAKVIVDGAYAGRHRSPYKGCSQEFTDYREYNPGDEIRSIDWKAYARTDRYIIKLFEKETIMTCHVMVDSSASMGFGGAKDERLFSSKDVSKFEYSCHLAAALCYLAIKQGDKAGLTLFDQRIKYHVPAGSTFSHLYRMLNLLEVNKIGNPTSIPKVLNEAFGMFKKKGMLILVSDLLDEPEEIFGALDMYRYKNFEIVLFHVLHRYELDLPPLPSINFVDSESGVRVSSVPADIRASYKERFGEYLQAISSIAQGRKIGYHLVTTDMPYQKVIEEYIYGRGK